MMASGDGFWCHVWLLVCFFGACIYSGALFIVPVFGVGLLLAFFKAFLYLFFSFICLYVSVSLVFHHETVGKMVRSTDSGYSGYSGCSGYSGYSGY